MNLYLIILDLASGKKVEFITEKLQSRNKIEALAEARGMLENNELFKHEEEESYQYYKYGVEKITVKGPYNTREELEEDNNKITFLK